MNIFSSGFVQQVLQHEVQTPVSRQHRFSRLFSVLSITHKRLSTFDSFVSEPFHIRSFFHAIFFFISEFHIFLFSFAFAKTRWISTFYIVTCNRFANANSERFTLWIWSLKFFERREAFIVDILTWNELKKLTKRHVQRKILASRDAVDFGRKLSTLMHFLIRKKYEQTLDIFKDSFFMSKLTWRYFSHVAERDPEGGDCSTTCANSSPSNISSSQVHFGLPLLHKNTNPLYS